MPTPYDTNALIAQSKAILAQTAAEGTKAFKGSSFDTATPVAPTGTITPSQLAPKTATMPVIAQTPRITTPAPVAPPKATDLTSGETGALDASALASQRIADLSAQLAGGTARTVELQKQQDVIGKQSAVASFQNQARQLQAEAQAIDLQLQQDIQAQQTQAQMGGANVTKGGLAPQTRALQTRATQSRLDNAIKQYSVNASLAAAQGDLTTALNYVDQAVRLEFEPIKAQLDAEIANLEKIRTSPEYTQAEKKKAMQLQIEVQKELDENEKASNAKTAIYDLAIKAQTLGADQLIIEAIKSAQTPEEAQSIMLDSGLFAPQAEMDNQIVKLDNGETVVVDRATGKIVNRLGGGTPSTPSISGATSVTLPSGETVSISNDAQQWVDAINSGSVSLDEALSKIGSTAASLSLKNEIIAGINAQGGQTATKLAQMEQNVSLIDDILSGDVEYFGASIAPREGFLAKLIGGNPYYEAFKAKVDNLVSSLTVDNLGLLKGPMSDKDIEFVKSLSSGLNMKMSESEAKKRLEQIKERLTSKINEASTSNIIPTSTSTYVSPLGRTYNF